MSVPAGELGGGKLIPAGTSSGHYSFIDGVSHTDG